MITYFNVHPNAVQYFFRRKASILDENMDLLRKYSGLDYRLYVEYDSVTLINLSENKIIFHSKHTRSMSEICTIVAELRDMWKYLKHPELITDQYLYNRYIHLINKYYG